MHCEYGMIRVLAAVLALVVPTCWQPPVGGPVVRPFQAPACTWCAGHRGLEYRPTPGTAVHAVADGTVVFAGPVVGVNYLVIRVADGRRVTLGFLAQVLARPGQQVSAGQVVALSSGRLFLGVRVGNHHVDPAPLLGRPRGRLRLVPVDGQASRPGSSPGRTCAAAVLAR
jgi:murein DD-endopeptidase MepM/ murein hydrolase activator NlpD